MKKIEYVSGCEKEYSEYLKTELETVQKKWEVEYNKFNELQVFPKDVKKIVEADFEQLTKWYFVYINISTNNDKIDKALIDRGKGKKSKLNVFDYNKLYPKIIKYFCEKKSLKNISSCYYCDIHPIGQYIKNKNNPRLTVDLDHFYPKDQCPILALSLYNFIPSCQVCNSRVKGRTDFIKFYQIEKSLTSDEKSSLLLKLSPSSQDYSFDNNAQLLVLPKIGFSSKFTFLDNLDKYEIHFSSDDNYEKEINAFKLEQRYNSITILSEALSILDLRRKFPLSKIREIKQLFLDSEIPVSEEQIEEIIFRKDYDKNKHSNLLKLKQDLLE